MAGLVAAWRAARSGRKVRVISKGWSSLYWHAGCVDVLGYAPGGEMVTSPVASLADLVRDNPRHPYSLAGTAALSEALEALKELCARAGYPLHGALERNWLLPTALGTARPTCLAPETMIAGDLRQPGAMLVIGFERFLDFYPDLIADNLQHQNIPTRGVTIELASLRSQRFITGRVLAESFDKPEFRAEVAAAVKAQMARGTPERIGFPAVLGLRYSIDAWRDLQALLGLPVFEVPTLPPSIPGMRLHSILVGAIEKLGGRVYEGMQVLSADAETDHLKTVWSEAAARTKPHRAASFILATGGILGGGLRVDPDESAWEVILGLQLGSLSQASRGVERQFLTPAGHPVFRLGLEVDANFQPLDPTGRRHYENLYAAGNALAHFDAILERSLEGTALASGYQVGRQEGL
jgi:glycerol-3-phosphate dehydrogenase subunit B